MNVEHLHDLEDHIISLHECGLSPSEIRKALPTPACIQFIRKTIGATALPYPPSTDEIDDYWL